MARCQGTVESLCQELLDLDDDKFGAMCSAFGYLQEWPDLGAMCGASLGATPGAVAPGAGDGNDDSSCSGSGGGGGLKKRRPDACLDAKGDGNDMSKRPRGKQQQQQLCGLGEVAAPGKGKQERPKAGTKKKAEAASTAVAAGQKTDYIHVRARRGQATDSHSLAERFLSMKIAASNPVVSFDIVEDLFGRQLKQACSPAALPAMALPAGQLEPTGLQMSPLQQVHPSAAAGFNGFGLDMVVNNLYPPAAASCPVSAATPVMAAGGPSIEPCLNVNGAAAAAAAWDIGSQNPFGGFDAQFQSVESE
ncbi:hypothetical protein C2845_PM12G24640 [Panicum miliaceum]|uniref:Uncharacterized protein n=1 Tax=Panicum miliaceum TaxID=4540 RepID=A0A3L6QJU6_PANMI|nr:hypothetical protein C2845_PM12G24640 [Panicum miliaceum]